MANYPQELAQDAAYQSLTNHLTVLWSLPKPAQGLNSYNNRKIWKKLLFDRGLVFLFVLPS